MNIEKLLDQLAHLDPYKLQVLRENLERYHDRKVLAIVGRLVLAAMALFFWLLKG